MRIPFAKLLVTLLVPALLAACSVSSVVRVRDRASIPVATMLGELRDTPVVFVGELHDTPSHHRLQLEVIRDKLAAGKRIAIGMEMFETPAQPELEAWCAGRISEASFRLVYERNWRNLPWGLYREILVFARDNHLPVVALNAPRELVQKVSHRGLAALTEQDLARLPEGSAAEVSDDYFRFIAGQYPGHGTGGAAFRNIAEAQMLRNRVMARTVADYLARHPGMGMVVIAGGGHARREGGVPAELGDGVASKVILPTMPFLRGNSVTLGDGDYLMEESDPLLWLFGSP